MIIDVSCDKNGAIESSHPTTIENPTYFMNGVLHYVVNHTPSLFYKTFSWNNSELIYPYLEELMMDEPGNVLKDALIVEKGIIVDQRINIFQGRK